MPFNRASGSSTVVSSLWSVSFVLGNGGGRAGGEEYTTLMDNSALSKAMKVIVLKLKRAIPLIDLIVKVGIMLLN